MNEVIECETTRIALRVSRDRDRRLLADLLDGHDVVDLTDDVPAETDLCIVDDRGMSRVDAVLAGWKRDQHPTYAPVLLLCESSGTDPWERYASMLGDRLDAIQPIPAPRAAIRARVESLLRTRRYSRDLASERQLVEQIFDTSPIAKTVLDTDGHIVRANRRAEAVLGLSESDISGRAYDAPEWRIIDENGDPIPSEDLPFARVMESGEPIYGFEHGVERPDGERVWLSVSMGPMRDENGDVEYLLGAIEDVTERKRQAKRFQAFVEGSSDIITVFDRNGRIEYASPAVERILGYESEALVGENAFDLVHPEDRDGLVEEVGKLFDAEDGPTITRRHRIRHADGSWRWAESRATAEGPPALGEVSVNTRDITDRVERERELERVFDRVTDAFAAVDAQWRFTYVNERAEELIDSTEEELLGRTHWEAYPEVVGTTFEEEYRRAMDTQEPVSFEEYYPPLDTWFAVRAYPSESGLSIYFRDVTERKERDRLLRRTQRAIEASGHAVYITDADGTIEYVNPAFERITGYDRDEVIGEDARVLNSEVLPETRYEELWATVRSGEVWDEEVVNQRKDGGRYHAAQTIAPIANADGEIEGFVAIQTDVTDHKDRLEQLQVMDRVLRHNLHNDMNVVRGYAELIQRRGPESVSGYAERILEYSDSLLDLADKQRKITKVLSTEPHLESIDVVSVIREIVERLSMKHPNAHIHHCFVDKIEDQLHKN